MKSGRPRCCISKRKRQTTYSATRASTVRPLTSLAASQTHPSRLRSHPSPPPPASPAVPAPTSPNHPVLHTAPLSQHDASRPGSARLIETLSRPALSSLRSASRSRWTSRANSFPTPARKVRKGILEFSGLCPNQRGSRGALGRLTREHQKGRGMRRGCMTVRLDSWTFSPVRRIAVSSPQRFLRQARIRRPG